MDYAIREKCVSGIQLFAQAMRGKKAPGNKTPQDVTNFIKEHINISRYPNMSVITHKKSLIDITLTLSSQIPKCMSYTKKGSEQTPVRDPASYWI